MSDQWLTNEQKRKGLFNFIALAPPLYYFKCNFNDLMASSLIQSKSYHNPNESRWGSGMMRNIGRGNRVFHIKELCMRLFLGLIVGKIASVYCFGPKPKQPLMFKKVEDPTGKTEGKL